MRGAPILRCPRSSSAVWTAAFSAHALTSTGTLLQLLDAQSGLGLGQRAVAVEFFSCLTCQGLEIRTLRCRDGLVAGVPVVRIELRRQYPPGQIE